MNWASEVQLLMCLTIPEVAEVPILTCQEACFRPSTTQALLDGEIYVYHLDNSGVK